MSSIVLSVQNYNSIVDMTLRQLSKTTKSQNSSTNHNYHNIKKVIIGEINLIREKKFHSPCYQV